MSVDGDVVVVVVVDAHVGIDGDGAVAGDGDVAGDVNATAAAPR